MKKFTNMLCLVFILFSFSCSDDSSSPSEDSGEWQPTYVNDPDPAGYYKFDVKTEYSDKVESMGAKNGLIAYLNYALNWCEVCEYGEDYSIWIKNLQRTYNDNNTEVKFTLELREPGNVHIFV